MLTSAREQLLLQRGDVVPHFTVSTVFGGTFDYSTIWQCRNLALIALVGRNSDDDSSYVRELSTRMGDFNARNTVCVVTHDTIDGMPRPGVLIADQWGEVVYTASPGDVSGLPSTLEIFGWIDYLEHRCPECEGEAK